MRIVVVHNRYLQPGGEDIAVEAEVALLAGRGHTVMRYETTNEELAKLGPVHQAAASVWNGNARKSLAAFVHEAEPEVVHFHNTFPWLSPAIYQIAGRKPLRIVQTLHNFRLVCPAATLLRAGRPCEDCVGKVPWRGVLHACYRDNHAATLVAATAVQVGRALDRKMHRVHAYIALTEFSRGVFVRGGIPASKVHVKPNFVAPDPGFSTARGEHFLFAGRLEEGKGARLLMEAWRRMPDPPALRILGTGPLESELRQLAQSVPQIRMLGQVPREEVLMELKTARALILPALWYENFPLLVCEAMATGCPVIAADGPNLREILLDGRAGLLFGSGEVDSLRRAVEWARDPNVDLATFAHTARAEFEARYSADANYRALLNIYEQPHAA
jgi:glycosyltransferase involved in cell wall biosynthesis